MQDIKKIKEKYLELFYDNYYGKSLNENPSGLILGENGYYFYDDIDYSLDGTNVWEPSFHYTRIEVELIKSGKDRILHDEEWRNKLIGALKYWVDNDFICSNWWYNQIHMPRAILSIALILDDYLSDKLRAGIEKLVLRGSYKNLLYYNNKDISDLSCEKQSKLYPYDWDGINLIWSALVTILHAVWSNDKKLLRFASDRLAKEINYSDRAGVSRDGAFFQHGIRWYSGGYGVHFVHEGAPLIYILSGTEFELPEEKNEVFLKHILEGLRTMMKNGYLDFNSLGRCYAAPNALDAITLVNGVKILSETENIARKDDLTSFYHEIENHKDNYEATRFYGSVCQLCHKKDGVYIGIHGRTHGIRGGEGYASIGFLGYNTTYGTLTCYMESGQEYYNVAPFWDYSKLPGTTAREENEAELQNHGDWTFERETECEAVGIAEKDKGILSERAVHDGISVQTAFFTFGSVLVALGTDVQDITPEKGKLFTTVEQCKAKDVVINEKTVTRGCVTYKNLGNTKFISTFCETEGNWKRNSVDHSAKIIKDDILTITIPVTSGDSYAYMIFKDNAPQIEILRNDKNCQAILIDGKTVMAAFHNECELLANGETIRGKKDEFIIK